MDFYRQVIQTNPNLIYVKNEQGKFILANNAYAALHGQSVATLLEKGITDSDYSYEKDLELIRNNDTIIYEEFYKHHNGQKIWFKTIKKQLVQPDGTYYLLSVSTDITDLKRARQQAEDSAKVKEILFANMSHEIRTPLNAIMGMAKLMEKSNLNKEQEEYLNIIFSNADKLLDVHNTILDYADLASGKVSLKKMPFNVAATIQEAVHSLARKHEVSVQFKKPAEYLPIVEGDPERLTQIFTSLVTEIIKVTLIQEIIITAAIKEQTNQQVIIDFSIEVIDKDNGSARFQNAFRTFLQDNNSMAALADGANLGFAVCKCLTELHGGRLWLQNKPDSDTQVYFCLSFPISNNQALVKQTTEIPQATNKLTGLKVLLTEDNLVNQLLVTSYLKAWEAQVDVASDGEEALEKVRKALYDVILMDIQMPRMNGDEAMIHIREDANPNQETPIIAFTANVIKSDRQYYLDAGFDAYISKPFNEETLYGTIIQVTQGKAAKALSELDAPENTHPADKESQTALNVNDSDPANKLYDLSGLGSLAHNVDFEREMLQMFIHTVPEQLDQLETAATQPNWAEVVHISHSLKATYGNLSIKDAFLTMQTIERTAANREDLDKIVPAIKTAKELTEKVIRQCTARLDYLRA